MNSIEILVHEHDNILRMLHVVQKASLQVLGGEAADVADFKKMIGFIRNYADKTHHGKEEEFLFKEMVDSLGIIGDNLVRHGMLVEHNLGRLHVSDLEDALTAYAQNATDESRLAILVAAGSYVNLLRRHIERENAVVFSFGEKNLAADALARVEAQTAAFESDPQNVAIREEQLHILDELEKKYR